MILDPNFEIGKACLCVDWGPERPTWIIFWGTTMIFIKVAFQEKFSSIYKHHQGLIPGFILAFSVPSKIILAIQLIWNASGRKWYLMRTKPLSIVKPRWQYLEKTNPKSWFIMYPELICGPEHWGSEPGSAINLTRQWLHHYNNVRWQSQTSGIACHRCLRRSHVLMIEWALEKCTSINLIYILWVIK